MGYAKPSQLIKIQTLLVAADFRRRKRQHLRGKARPHGVDWILVLLARIRSTKIELALRSAYLSPGVFRHRQHKSWQRAERK